MTEPFLAPSLIRLRDRINARWPNRSKASDGWIGDAAHQTRDSDHNPDGDGMVHAIDVTREGVVIGDLLAGVIGHPAVNYVIYNGQIWSRIRGFRPVPYTGPSPHEHHVHVSILHTHNAEHWSGLWLPNEEDTMPLSDEDLRKIGDLVDVRIKNRVEDIVTGFLNARIEKGYLDKNKDGKPDVETVWQGIAGAHADAYNLHAKVDHIAEILTALQAESRAGE